MHLRAIHVACAFVLSLASCAEARAASPSQPVAELIRRFQHHPLVQFGELHRNVQQHAFLQELLREPGFICQADDVVVEFGNPRLQAVAEAYTTGEAVAEDVLQGVWRDTEVPFAWNSPLYRRFYDTVRAINVDRLCPRPVRIVLGALPLDWSKVRTVADLEALPERDAHLAEVVEREVLAKGRRAFIVTGKFHALKKLPKRTPGGAMDPPFALLIEQRHPGKLFSVVPVPTAAAARTLGMGAAPSLGIVKGSGLERFDFGIITPGLTVTLVKQDGKHVWRPNKDHGWPRMGEIVDALVFLGGDETALFPPPSIYLEPAYQAELRRRVQVIKAWSGQDFPTVLEELIEEAKRVGE